MLREAGPGEGEHDRARIDRPLLGRLGQHTGHEAIERLGRAGLERAQPRRLLDDDLGEESLELVSLERPLAGDTLEDQAPEREDVRARVDRVLSGGLLGRHVRRGPDEQPGRGQREIGLDEPRDAKVEQGELLQLARTQEDVAGLQITVNDAALVCDGEGGGDALGDDDRIRRAERASLQPVRQVLSLHPFHREEEAAFLSPALGRKAPLSLLAFKSAPWAT